MTTKEELVQLLSRPIVFQMPKRLLPPPSWTMHTPYAMWLIDVLRPRTFVELGAFKGTSYCAFCQAVKELQVGTKCFAVDTWQGDPHSNFYGDEVFQNLKTHHDEHYAAFSTMVRKDFDSALPDFEDGSIDLLHIDGFHTYEAVKHDFETWLPKVSDRGVILFHDISVREKDFGVWQFWDEVKARYPHLEVAFGNGLGTLLVGSEIPPEFVSIVSTITSSQDGIKTFQGFFEHLGRVCNYEVEKQNLSELVDARQAEIVKTSHAWELRGNEIERLQKIEIELRAENVQLSKGGVRSNKSGTRIGENLGRDAEAATRIRKKIFRLTDLRGREKLSLAVEQVPGMIRANLCKWAWRDGRFKPLRKGLKKLLNSSRTEREASLIRASGLFDEEFYRAQLGVPLPEGMCPLTHFLLVGASMQVSPHPLFDARFYRASHTSRGAVRGNPLIHYLSQGWREERSPHPLFDVAFYRTQQQDREQEPLQHYLRSRPGFYLNPNRLFDSKYYLHENQGKVPAAINPLIHFISEGADEGFKCHPLFDPGFYFAKYPDVHEDGWNPLVHYLSHGWREGRLTAESVDLSFSGNGDSSQAATTNDEARAPVGRAHLFIVYGASHVSFIKNVFLPSLAAHSGKRPVDVHVVNYVDSTPLLSDVHVNEHVTIRDWSASRQGGQIGFGEAHNFLFKAVAPKDCFVVVNPDSIPLEGCLDALFETFERTSAGIVEARQWPSAHPKEYDIRSGDTPWASGAFCLIDSDIFSRIGGFDPVFFLYDEDVDLSWRVWLAGRRVLHEPRALCAHFTGMFSYRDDRFYHEHFYSTRNFLVLARKFFGEEGEPKALNLVTQSGFPEEFKKSIISSYHQMRDKIVELPRQRHPMIKILGMNIYHFPQPPAECLGYEQQIIGEEPLAHVG